MREAIFNFHTFTISVKSNKELIPGELSGFMCKSPSPMNITLRTIYSSIKEEKFGRSGSSLYLLINDCAPEDRLRNVAARVFGMMRKLPLPLLSIHAAGIVFNGKCNLFVGESGIGKTTISRILSFKHKVISEESVLIHKIPQGFMASSFPFLYPQHVTSPGIFPVGEIYLLKKAKTNFMEHAEFEDALKVLKRESTLINLPETTVENFLHSRPYAWLHHYPFDEKGLLNAIAGEKE